MNEAPVRAMAPEDLERVSGIEAEVNYAAWSLESFREALQAPYRAWVWLEGDEVVAYGVISLAAGECSLLSLCVDVACQGQGIGRRLLTIILQDAAGEAESCFLEVRASNRKAISLYESAGFLCQGRRRAYYPLGEGREDALLYSLDLSP